MRKIAENRYHAEIGMFHEEYKVGDIYEHRPGRAITEADNIQFPPLTMNPRYAHPNHAPVRGSSRYTPPDPSRTAAIS